MTEKENPSEHEHEQAPMAAENPLANLDEETQRKIQEIQIIEQNFQQLMMQKQSYTFELNESNLALDELKKAEGDVFKIVANQVVLKTNKPDLEKELSHKKELIETRLKSIEKQEKEFSEKLEALKKEIMEKISPQEKA